MACNVSNSSYPSIAVLGANGFIGTRVIEVMHLGGWARVRAVVRRPAGLARAKRFPVEGCVADARDKNALRRAFSGCDAVIHAVAGGPEIILDTLQPVYEAAEAAGVTRIIYLSSAAVHGQCPSPGTDESTPLSTRHPLAYNRAKVQAEKRLRELRARSRVELVILRPGIVYGPRSQWTAGLADKLLEGSCSLLNGGTGICNSIYIDNLLQAIRLSLVSPKADKNAYLVGDAETLTWLDFCRPIASALEAPLPILDATPIVPRRGLHQMVSSSRFIRKAFDQLPYSVKKRVRAGYDAWRSGRRHLQQDTLASREWMLLQQCRYKLPHAKATAELGYQPSVSFDEGIRRSLLWLTFAGYPIRAKI